MTDIEIWDVSCDFMWVSCESLKSASSSWIRKVTTRNTERGWKYWIDGVWLTAVPRRQVRCYTFYNHKWVKDQHSHRARIRKQPVLYHSYHYRRKMKMLEMERLHKHVRQSMIYALAPDKKLNKNHIWREIDFLALTNSVNNSGIILRVIMSVYDWRITPSIQCENGKLFIFTKEMKEENES